MFKKAYAIWRPDILFGGEEEPLIDFLVDAGCDCLMPKIGNGTTPWAEKEPLIKAANARGLKVVVWWFEYGYTAESGAIHNHLRTLLDQGCKIDGFAHDWESRADGSSATKAELEAKARQLTLGVLTAGGDIEQALCSWWKPSYHRKTPYEAFFERCQWNMPMAYDMGCYSQGCSAGRVEESLDEYRYYGIEPERTIIGLSSFGQTIGRSDGSEYYWITTAGQIKAAHAEAIDSGCQGDYFWSADFVLGGAGSQGYRPNVPMQEAVKACVWPGSEPPEPPEPPPVSGDVEARLAALEARTSILTVAQEEIGTELTKIETWAKAIDYKG